MYPAIVDWLRHGPLPWLAWLVPIPGLMHAMVLVVVGGTFIRRVRYLGFSRQQALEAALAGAVSALVFTRVFYLVTRTRFWEMPLAELADGAKGTASWGAYLGGAVGLVVYALIVRINPLRLMDVGASVAALSCVVGRWNCFLIGDDFGRVTTLSWGIRYPAGSLAWRAHVRRGLIDDTAAWSLPVHPNQLLLAGMALVTFLITSRYWVRHRAEPGKTLGTFLIAYGATRFPVEFLRDPAGGGATGLLSHSQYMCIGFVATGLLLHFLLARVIPSTVNASQPWLYVRG
jgi:phosphatidylglycerol:prolipoprotein diacylglycerol transferase